MKTTTANTFTTEEQSTSISNIVLKDGSVLQAKKITKIFSVKYKLNSKTLEPYRVISRKLIHEETELLSYPLHEITMEELAAYRTGGVPSFVLKKNKKYYWCKIPASMSFYSSTILGPHKCAASGHDCHRLSPASDENGGCAKVRNYATCIEKFPFITSGYETFNTDHDSFVVANCLNYEKCPPRKKYTREEWRNMQETLADYMWK